MTNRPKHLLSRIEAEELYEALRGMCGHEEGQTFEHFVSAHRLLQSKGLVEIVESEWDTSMKDVNPTEAGRDEHLRYQNLPRFEDQLIQAISYLETHHQHIAVVVNGGFTVNVPSSQLSVSLIALANALREKAGAK